MVETTIKKVSCRESGNLLYLDLPKHLHALPDLGLEALEHVRVPRRQSLQRVLRKQTSKSPQVSSENPSQARPNPDRSSKQQKQKHHRRNPHLNRLHEVGLVLRAELCITATESKSSISQPHQQQQQNGATEIELEREREEPRTFGVGDGGAEAGEVEGVLAVAHGGYARVPEASGGRSPRGRLGRRETLAAAAARAVGVERRGEGSGGGGDRKREEARNAGMRFIAGRVGTALLACGEGRRRFLVCFGLESSAVVWGPTCRREGAARPEYPLLPTRCHCSRSHWLAWQGVFTLLKEKKKKF